MVNKVIGYVKHKFTGDIQPYINRDENGYELANGKWWYLCSVTDEPEEKTTNTYIQNVHTLIDRQQEKGLKKYGTLVNKDDYSLIGWIEHAQQEAADLLIYLEVIKSKVKDVIG